MRQTIPWFQAGLTLGSLALLQSIADPLDKWEWLNPRPQGNTLRSINYVGDSFFAVGELGTILRSTNGLDWSLLSVETANTLFGVSHGDNLYVAVGDSGTILTSSDGLNWSNQSSGSANPLYSVTYGNGTFVAVGGTILTSTNGTNWTPSTGSSSTDLHGVTFANGLFVAEGLAFDILVSGDGMNWSAHPAQCFGGGIVFGNGLFVAVGNYFLVNGNESSYRGEALASRDGTNWQRTDLGWELIEGVAVGNGTFVAVDYDGGAYISTDGSIWTRSNIVSSDNIYGIAFGSGRFVAVGSGGNLLSSADGVTWVSHRSGPAVVGSLTYANNLFVALGPANTVLTSGDGVDWNLNDSGSSNRLSDLAYGDGKFVAVGSHGTILTSSNGLNWALQSSSTTNDLGPVAYGNGKFMALAQNALTATNNGVVVSTNGSDWEWKAVPAVYLAFGFTYGNGLFVVVGGQLGYTTINTSPDGAVWTDRISGTTNAQSGDAYGVAFGRGVFVVAGENADQNGTFGTLLVSKNGMDWNYARTQSRLFGLTYAGGVFIAWQNGKIVTSVDGVHWISRAFPFPASHFTFANNAFVAVGGGGAVLRSASTSTMLLPGLRSLTGDFSMNLVGLLGFTYRVQASGDLKIWKDLQSFTSIQTAVSVLDTNASLFPNRFYRALQQ